MLAGGMHVIHGGNERSVVLQNHGQMRQGVRSWKCHSGVCSCTKGFVGGLCQQVGVPET